MIEHIPGHDKWLDPPKNIEWDHLLDYLQDCGLHPFEIKAAVKIYLGEDPEEP